MLLPIRYLRYIQTYVSFLTIISKSPDEDDWGKLKIMIEYFKVGKYMKINLSVDTLSTINW